MLYGHTVSSHVEVAVRFKVVVNGSHYVGELVTHAVGVARERYHFATLRPADPVAQSPIPELYEPVLLGFAPQAFRLRGFERAEGPRGWLAVVQEWHCEPP
jgi:hypothetical protein